MLKALIDKILANNFNDLHGSHLHLMVPISIPVINELLLRASENNKQIQDLKVIKINGDEITLSLTLVPVTVIGKTFDLIDRKMMIKIHPKLEGPDFLLKVEIMDGLKKWENEVLQILFNTIINSAAIDFESRVFFIKHKELSKNEVFHELVRRITTAQILTFEDKIVYDLTVNFE